MLDFPEPPRSYAAVSLRETVKPLPKKIDPRTRYAFFSTIAEGGKSLIKSCKDLHLCRFICFKTLKPEFANDEVEQQRLIREARVTGMLQHPNTVPTYELGRDTRGSPYFTMKLVHGYTLREVLGYRDRYDLKQLMDVMVQVGLALQYAHTAGVAHRDIKPENILVGPYGEVLLLDWGLAKLWKIKPGADSTAGKTPVAADAPVSSLTGDAPPQGTPRYMSPEQINRDPELDYRSDIYSLGAVIYEVLCGQAPARGKAMHHIVSSILNDTPPNPSEASRRPVPKLLEDITMRCLEKHPDKRFQSIHEVLRLLQEDWQHEPPRGPGPAATVVSG